MNDYQLASMGTCGSQRATELRKLCSASGESRDNAQVHKTLGGEQLIKLKLRQPVTY